MSIYHGLAMPEGTCLNGHQGSRSITPGRLGEELSTCTMIQRVLMHVHQPNLEQFSTQKISPKDPQPLASKNPKSSPI